MEFKEEPIDPEEIQDPDDGVLEGEEPEEEVIEEEVEEIVDEDEDEDEDDEDVIE